MGLSRPASRCSVTSGKACRNSFSSSTFFSICRDSLSASFVKLPASRSTVPAAPKFRYRSPADTRAVVVSREVAKANSKSFAGMLFRGVRKRKCLNPPSAPYAEKSRRARAVMSTSAPSCKVSAIPAAFCTFTMGRLAVSRASISRPRVASRCPSPSTSSLSAEKSAFAFPPATVASSFSPPRSHVP